LTDWKLGRTYDSACGEVRWDSFGEAGKDPVVLLHGTPFSSYVWRGVARALAHRHQVFVWDMPGYGASEKADGQDVSLAAQGRVFTDLLAHWGLGEPAVVAHDFGGAVALRAHLLHDARYRRLALVDPVALAPWGSPFFRLVGEHSTVFDQLPPALHRALVREYVSSASSPGLHPASLDRLVEPWLGDGGQAAFYRQIAQADQRYTDEVPGPVRLGRHPGAGLLGCRGHLDSPRQGRGTRLPHPRRTAHDHPRRRTPRPGRRPGRTRRCSPGLPPRPRLTPARRKAVEPQLPVSLPCSPPCRLIEDVPLYTK
jgi:pimeloyl-ACP methyl ester carboxylesterase